MSSYMPPWQRRPPARPKPEPREPTLSQLALAEMMQAEPEPPLGGWAGEIAVASNQPPLPAPPRMVIPPPPWSENYRPELDPDYQEPGVVEEEPAPHPPPTRGAA